MEKKEGTRLYSVAPFLLLLFKEDVEAAVIPETVTQCVYTAVREAAGATSAANAAVANSAGAKVAAGQTAKMALKTKIILGIVGAGAAAAIAGTTYAVVTARQAQMAANDMQQDDDGWVTPELEPEESEQVAQEETQEESQEETEASEEELECFKVLSEYLVSTDWEEETYKGNTIELKDYKALDFIDMLSKDNVDEDGKYDAYLPEYTIEGGQTIYTEQSIKEYVWEVVNHTLSAKYRSNRGAELWFNEDGSVLVSESGGHTSCSYTLDADGNLTIYASSETLEGKYNAEQDRVTLYGINYYRE